MNLENTVMSMYIEKYLVTKQRHNHNPIHIYNEAHIGASHSDTQCDHTCPYWTNPSILTIIILAIL